MHILFWCSHGARRSNIIKARVKERSFFLWWTSYHQHGWGDMLMPDSTCEELELSITWHSPPYTTEDRWLDLENRRGVKSWENASQLWRRTSATPIHAWSRKRLRAMQRKPRYENVVLCGPRQRSPVAWVNEVISRDGVSCHTLGAGLRVQSPSHVSIRGPPRQFTNRSNMARDGPRESTTVVLHANLHAGIAIMSAIMTLTSRCAPIPSWQLPLTPRGARKHKTNA